MKTLLLIPFAVGGLALVFVLYYRLIKHSYEDDRSRKDKGPL